MTPYNLVATRKMDSVPNDRHTPKKYGLACVSASIQSEVRSPPMAEPLEGRCRRLSQAALRTRCPGRGSSRGRASRIVADFSGCWQSRLVFGCIGTDFSKQMRVLQQFFNLRQYLTEISKYGNVLLKLKKFHQNHCPFEQKRNYSRDVVFFFFADAAVKKRCHPTNDHGMIS